MIQTFLQPFMNMEVAIAAGAIALLAIFIVWLIMRSLNERRNNDVYAAHQIEMTALTDLNKKCYMKLRFNH
jgi:hypothetical protein